MLDNNIYNCVRKQQESELKVMKALHLFCEKNSLRYCLGEGTLLGAIRHKGFIPWDNDMDIYMPREDVNKLLTLVENGTEIGESIQLFYYTCNPHYHYTVVRVCNMQTEIVAPYLREQIKHMGLWVDIFPLDGFDEKRYLIQKPLLWYNMKMLNLHIYLPSKEADIGIKKIVRKIILKTLPNKNHRYEKRISSICSWGKYSNSKKIAVLCEEIINPGRAILKEDFENAELIQFENAKFYVPRNAEKRLKAQYGDYMSLPPEDQRTPHDINVRYKDLTDLAKEVKMYG